MIKTKGIIDYEYEMDIKKADYIHNTKMEELEFVRETDRIRHEQDLERMRIKSAEIRKAQERKDWGRVHSH